MLILCIIFYVALFRNINFTNNNQFIICVFTTPLFIIYLILNNKILNFLKSYIKFLWILIFFITIHFISKIINLDKKIFSGVYLNIPIKLAIDLISASVIVDLLIKKRKKITSLFKIYIYCIFIDLTLGLLRVFFPTLNTILLSLNKIDHITQERIEGLSRLIPFGNRYFGTGLNSGIALILIIYIINKKNKIYYWIVYFYIFILAFLSSRTVLVAGVISIVYYIYINRFRIYKIYKGIIVALLSFIILLKSINKKIYNWAFELFIKRGETDSTNVLKNMWNIIPEDIKTWIIGDGKWMEGKKYYMNTDVGYLRLVWYVGIIGLFIYFYYLFFIYKNLVKDSSKEIKTLIGFIFIFLLVVNIKGYAEPFYLLFCLYILKMRLKLNESKLKNMQK